jgi:carboxymethylenebutenolidase
MYSTHDYEGMVAETVAMRGHDGKLIHAYFSRPLGPGPFPGMVFIHHLPGWDEWTKEAARKLAYHGIAAICPDLYHDEGPGSPEDVGARIRAEGGVSDDRVMADVEGALHYLKALPYMSGKVGVMGTCSGGRHTTLAAARVKGFAAAADLWGGRVVMTAEELTPKQPVAPIGLTAEVSCPLLGLFGNDDRFPTPEQVDQHEAALKQHGKTYEFHRYDGAGHGFFYHDRPQAYRAEQAVDGWQKLFGFLERHLATPA